MAMQRGELYRCAKQDCGCEIEVRKSAGPGGGNQAPKCCCGMEMTRFAVVGTEQPAAPPH